MSITEVRGIKTPEDIYGPLFSAVQESGIFADSKTFVDSTPQTDVAHILAQYAAESVQPGFDLLNFVHRHFLLPAETGAGHVTAQSDIHAHIRGLWAQLKRMPDALQPGSSLLPLPHPYIVPGGRFREIYYWDSYFTMLGLIQSGETDTARHMVDNFAHLIHTYGHIPNGNRTYFLSRSQPPFFAAMVMLIAELDGVRETLLRYKDSLVQEHNFWMDGVEQVGGQLNAYRRVVGLGNGGCLNRYWDDKPIPRQESHLEDCHLAAGRAGHAETLFRNIRAACESGWDFSSRWLLDPQNLASIDTTSILPVDLNVLLWQLENTISEAMSYAGDAEAARRYSAMAAARKQAMAHYFWEADAGCYLDYHWVSGSHMQRPSLAMAFPLWAGIARQEEADAVAQYMEKHLLRPGGLVTTTEHSGQQWDAPNGWPPLQWVSIAGLRRYGHMALAERIARNWMALNERVFERTGKMMEKYNVEDMSLLAGGGEYPVQDGFGWTNGVYLALLEWYGAH